MARLLIHELAKASLLVYSALLLSLQLLHAVLVGRWLGWGVAFDAAWPAAVGFLAFPLLIASGDRVAVTVRGRPWDLSRVAFLLAWALAFVAAYAFFGGSAAHDLDLILDGSHGRFCAGEGYVLDGPRLATLLFGVVPIAYWLTAGPASSITR